MQLIEFYFVMVMSSNKLVLLTLPKHGTHGTGVRINNRPVDSV